ncbi:MAG TPA: NAD(P)-dependent oxidoreductase [Ktedonobacteraceae bacterium]|jgi:nucleoside-diphosphate-sugar epimerase|nr:NAD(P)-dependent oxidoreductase [Ktedonobacteraceae bacterium]
MTKIVVTGGSGKAGRVVVKDLIDHGYEVLNVDLLPPPVRQSAYLKADLADFGQTVEVLHGADAVVHLGAIPAPGLQPEETTFRNNTLSTYNIFSAAVLLKLKRVVWASSETTLGLPFDREKPVYAPIDEDHPLYPESSYALSKVISEEMARQFSRRSGIPFVGLRFSNIIEPGQYVNFPSFSEDLWARKWNLWGYVDVRDVALSCRVSLEADIQGAEAFIIAAADTVMKQTNSELMAAVFPGVPLREGTGDFETLLSIKKARKLLGYEPQYSWRQL